MTVSHGSRAPTARRRAITPRLRPIALLPLALLAAGCYAHVRAPLTPVPVQLVSPEPFVVHVPATADSLANACQHLRVFASVSAVRGDTLFLSRVESQVRPTGVRDCVEGREGYVVLSAAPLMRAETGRVFVGRTILLLLVTGFIGALGLLILTLPAT